MVLDRTVIEAASWKLAATIARRHPELVIRREHPGGGQYDVLALRSGRGCVLMLNREGTVQVRARDDGREPSWEPMPWSEVIEQDPRKLVAELEDACGLAMVEHTPRSTPRVLVYRTLSALANLQVLSSPIDICMGAIDTSGYGAGPAEWLDDFPEIVQRVARTEDPTEEPRFDYWHAASGETRLAFDITSSDAWSIAGRRLSLATTYDDVGRSMPLLFAAVLELGAET